LGIGQENSMMPEDKLSGCVTEKEKTGGGEPMNPTLSQMLKSNSVRDDDKQDRNDEI